ncbi:MAG: alanine racemase [Firmicutes bacterium]|nr:alanine racemase [Bacillota bacterium]
MLEYQRLIAQIDLDAIENNVKQIKKQLDKGTKMLAVVKADAYGHGAVEVSKICLFNGADQLGIATCEEGCALREANIPVPILILGYTVESRLETVIENDLTQAVFSVEMAQKLSQTAVRMGKTAKAHIKIDTGMGRIGFLPCEESLDVIDGIFKLPNLEITGIFTHFSTADEKDKTFTKTQFERFLYMTRGLEERGHTGLIRHCANSGAIIDMPELQLDMVRAGIILYGMLPSTEVGTQLDLIPAMSLKTHISYVKQVEAGTPIGYGRTYYTDKPSKIATVPIGYADGYSRAFSNKARVIVNGEYANVVGNVCMDQIMLDVTHIKDIKMGDEVTVMGCCGDKCVSAEELADIASTINYEIVCNVGKRVPRVYLRGKKVIKVGIL